MKNSYIRELCPFILLLCLLILTTCKPEIQYNQVGEKLEYPEVTVNSSINKAVSELKSIEIKSGEQIKKIVIEGACNNNNILKLRETIREVEVKQKESNKSVEKSFTAEMTDEQKNGIRCKISVSV